MNENLSAPRSEELERAVRHVVQSLRPIHKRDPEAIRVHEARAIAHLRRVVEMDRERPAAKKSRNVKKRDGERITSADWDLEC